MIAGVIVKEAVGLLIIVLGLVLWLGRKVSILHAYHYKNVKEENLPAYCRMMGIGLMLVGLGIAVSGILDLFYSALWWIPTVVGFVLGLTVLFIAQKKYNGSILG
ncbi:MAG: DUF3784 domain-containing protein [Clostridia bacterium]|nr:DUF3784 domain-containing protein [Clostridia bacterium]